MEVSQGRRLRGVDLVIGEMRGMGEVRSRR
jgi:hypothetical protein